MLESLPSTITGAEEIRLVVGRHWWFEYHCLESHNSQDAKLWYRSHQRVEIVSVEQHDADLTMTREERGENGTPIVYRARFADGSQGTVFSDELCSSPASFCRPDPPRPPGTRRLTTAPAALPVQEKIPADGRFETVCCDCGLLHTWQIVPCADGGYMLTVWRGDGS